MKNTMAPAMTKRSSPEEPLTVSTQPLLARRYVCSARAPRVRASRFTAHDSRVSRFAHERVDVDARG